MAAEAIYAQVLQQDPDHGDALHLYGCLADDLGKPDQAIGLLTRAIESNRKAFPYYYNLANILKSQGRLEEAIGKYRAALRLKPDYAQAYNNLGMALTAQGDEVGAKSCFEKATRIKPDYADAHYNLGLSLTKEGDLKGAIDRYQKAIRIRPDYLDAYYNMANALSAAERLEEAIAGYREALHINSSDHRIYTNLGSALLKLGHQEEAELSFQEALKLNPSDTLNYSNLIVSACYLSVDPSIIHTRCKAWANHVDQLIPPENRHYANDPNPARPLRIGYVSADFRHHAAAYWIEPLLAAHDAANFAVFCYDNFGGADEVKRRLKTYQNTWVDCSTLRDDELTERIRRDGIDILVDLSGHTDGNRLLVFARGPAPVQVGWFGFPVSTGLKTMDYRLTDGTMDPEGETESYYSEKLVRLSRFYASFQPESGVMEPGSPPVLHNGYVTFASLNNWAKITPRMLELWASLLLSVPDSRLLIQAGGMDGDGTKAKIHKFFEAKSVDGERIILRGWCGIKQYLDLGQDVDIALDPYPFNGGVTTFHSLWMGVPVVTMAGRTAPSRVGKSILSQIGLPELVADSDEQYLEIAANLAGQPHTLETLRMSMRDRMTRARLLDGGGLTREVEAAYRRMWNDWCTDRG